MFKNNWSASETSCGQSIKNYHIFNCIPLNAPAMKSQKETSSDALQDCASM